MSHAETGRAAWSLPTGTTRSYGLEDNPLIPTAEQITPQWLTVRLQQNGHLRNSTVTDVQIGETFESTAAFLTPLKVAYSTESDDLPHRHLIFKHYRKDWYGGGLVESVFFRDIAAQMPNPPVFQCYDADNNRSTYQCYLIFEDASVTHTQEPPRDEAFTVVLYKQILDELLKFHVQWWEHPRISQDDFLRGRGGPLRMVDAATPAITQTYCQYWREDLLPRFVQTFQAELSQEMATFARRAIDSWEYLYVERIREGQGLTFLHGDLHRWNIFYPKSPETHGLYLADWETYKRGIGPYDLCYLLSAESPERRRRIERDLLRYYHNGLVNGGVVGYSWEGCLSDYRLSVIANLFPPLGWQRLSALQNQRIQFEDWDCEELLG